MKNNSISLVIAGFSVVLALMFSLVLISQYQVQIISTTLSKLIEETNVKVQSAYTMRDAIRMRELSLKKMRITRDVFERDEIHMEFLYHAGVYRLARANLLNHKMNETEENFLTTLTNLTRQAQPFNDKSAELLMSFASDDELRPVLKKSIMLQKSILMILDELVKYENNDAIEARRAANEKNNNIRSFIYLLTAAAFVLCVIVVKLVTKNVRRVNKKITYQATHDALTGLVNRREFEYRVSMALDRAKIDNRTHAMLYMDLDQFKIVNDTCGHIAGDQLLKKLPPLLNALIRKHDTLARLGGDEFGLLLEDCSISSAVLLAEEIREEIQRFRFSFDEKYFQLVLVLVLFQLPVLILS
jgi:diguanylate cyclase (GGDEF)-like protein